MKAAKLKTKGQSIIQCYSVEFEGQKRIFGKIRGIHNLWVAVVNHTSLGPQVSFEASSIEEATETAIKIFKFMNNEQRNQLN